MTTAELCISYELLAKSGSCNCRLRDADIVPLAGYRSCPQLNQGRAAATCFINQIWLRESVQHVVTQMAILC